MYSLAVYAAMIYDALHVCDTFFEMEQPDMKRSNDVREPDSTPHLVKKPYSTPHLHLYGDIREITRGVGRNGLNDLGAGMGNDRTAP